jgi:hypothetical protein
MSDLRMSENCSSGIDFGCEAKTRVVYRKKPMRIKVSVILQLLARMIEFVI